MTLWGRRTGATALLGALGALGAMVGLVAACGPGGGRAAQRVSAESSTTRVAAPSSTTSTTVPLYSFDNSVPPPPLVQTGTDHKRILQSLLDYGNWTAAHHPDPDLIGTFVAAGSSLARAYERVLPVLMRNDTRLYETRTGPNEIILVTVKPDLFSARVLEKIGEQGSVDRAGNITGRRFALNPVTRYVYVVAKQGDRWKLVDGLQSPGSFR